MILHSLYVRPYREDGYIPNLNMKITPIPFTVISHTVLRLASSLGNKSISYVRQAETPRLDSSFANSETIGLGSNINDALGEESRVVQIPNRIKLPRSLRITNEDGLEYSVKDFLAKPWVSSSGSLTTSDVATSFGMTDCTIALQISPLHVAKVSGASGIRFTSVMTLHVNASPFQSGIYLLAFLPCAGAGGGSTQFDNWTRSHAYSIVQVSQLPHVKLDIACDTQVQLKFPWTSAFNAWTPNTGTPIRQWGTPGYFFIYPYTPLQAGSGSTTAGFTLTLHYEDVEIIGNTISQSGRIKSKNPVADETANKPISGGLKLMAKSFDMFARIPLLSSVAGPTSWFLDAAAQAAWSFGFSRPQIVTAPQRVYTALDPYGCNTDAPNDADMLAYSCNNQIKTFQAAATDMDEMSYDYLKTIPSFYQSIVWGPSQTSGTSLGNFFLSPGTFYSILSDTSNNLYNLSPICLLANSHSYYTGSITIDFIIARTRFHSGRLAIAFIPYDVAYTAPTPSYANIAYYHHTILDVRESNTATINFPWMSNTPWKRAGNVSEPYGLFVVFVMDPLVSPSSVPTNVTINMEVRGGPDLQFAVPNKLVSTFRPVIPLIRQSGDPCILTTDSVGGTKMDAINLELTEYTMGEAIHSLRTLLKRDCYFTNSTFTTTFAYAQIRPFDIWYNVSLAGGVYQSAIPWYGTHNVWLSCFSMMRGSMRYKMYADATTGTSAGTTVLTNIFHDVANEITPHNVPLINLTAPAPFTLTFSGLGSAFSYTNTLRSGVSVTVPHYYPLHSRPVILNTQYGTTANPSASGSFADAQYLMMQALVSTTAGVEFYRSIGDDFSSHGFVSIPPMQIQAAT